MTLRSRGEGCTAREHPRALLAVAVVALLGLADPAHAGANCSITSVGLNFGLYDPAGTQPDDVAASVTVTCVYVAPGTTNVSYTLALSNGGPGRTGAPGPAGRYPRCAIPARRARQRETGEEFG